MSSELQKYELDVSMLGMEGYIHLSVSAYDEFHAIRLAEATFNERQAIRVEYVHLVA